MKYYILLFGLWLGTGLTPTLAQELPVIKGAEQVDLKSGDFTYTVPVLEIPGPHGGYPISFAYRSGVQRGQESSWIGLGWSLQAGQILREINGYPDDFQGTEVATIYQQNYSRGYHRLASPTSLYTDFEIDYGNEIGSGSSNLTYTENMYGAFYSGEVANDNYIVPASGTSDLTPRYRDINNQWVSSPKYLYPNNGSYLVMDAAIEGFDPSIQNPTAQNFGIAALTFDRYTVSNSNFSGRLLPFRPEVGSIAVRPSGMNGYHHQREYPIPFLKWGDADYHKTGFVFWGLTDNYYDWVNFQAGPGAVTTAYNSTNKRYTWSLGAHLNDPAQRIDKRTDGSLYGNNLVQRKAIQWFTHAEILNGTAAAAGFCDFAATSISQLLRQPYPSHHIGGFAVTDENGITYHYALPVYNMTQTYVSEEYDPQGVGGPPDRTTYTMNAPYPVQWLLTAITGPNFRDQGTVANVVDNQDEGYWVHFQYGRFTDNKNWHFPKGISSSHYYNKDLDARMRQNGSTEEYYLNTIHTQTHVALFPKSLKTEESDGPNSLKLDEILLLTRQDFESLNWNAATVSGLTPNESVAGILLTAELPTDIASKQLIRVDFRYAPPSQNFLRSPIIPGSGHLRLEAVSLSGRNNTKLQPDILFNHEEAYDPGGNPVMFPTDAIDGWNYPKNSTSFTKTSGNVTGVNYNAANYLDPCRLTEIVQPEGSRLHITYERDTYQQVWNEQLPTKRYGSNLRVSLLEYEDPTQNTSYFVKYSYEDSDVPGHSYGFCTSEPSSLAQPASTGNYFADHSAFPTMNLIYQQVARYDKYDPVQQTYQHKQVFVHDVSTDHYKEVIEREGYPESAKQPAHTYLGTQFYEYYHESRNTLRDRTAFLGLLKRVDSYNSYDELVQRTTYAYRRGATIAQSFILSDRIGVADLAQGWASDIYRRLIMSDISYEFPFLYQAKTTTQEGASLETYEVNSAQALRPVTRINRQVPTGKSTTEVTQYTFGTQNSGIANYNLGSIHNGGKNVFTLARGKTALYGGSSDHITAATATAFSRDYYVRQRVGNNYTSQWATGNALPARTGNYAWKSLLDVNNDGSVASSQFTAFNWSNPSASVPEWQPTTGVTLVGPDQEELEWKNADEQYGCAHYGYGEHHLKFLEASFARFNEATYTGAEWAVDALFLNGEIPAAAYRHAGTPHTGSYSLRIPASTTVPLVERTIGTGVNDIRAQDYIAYVWVNYGGVYARRGFGRLYYQLKDGSSVVHTAELPPFETLDEVDRAGSWYLIRLRIPVTQHPTANNLVVGIKNTGGSTIHFDDFKWMPESASVKTYVFDPASRKVIAEFDHQHLATRYQLDAAFRIIGVQNEFLEEGTDIGGFRKTEERVYNFGRP